MAQTTVHGGINISFTSEAQHTSAMSNFAANTHLHSQYLTTAANSTHLHSQYLTTAALSNHIHSNYQTVGAYLTTAAMTNHSHTNYLNISESGNVYFINGNGVSFSSNVSGINTTIGASVNTVGGTLVGGNNYFINTNGHSFGSSVNGNSTFNWIII
jgi:hypothetical protein